jgi:glucose/arabinose dehydrogenase
LICEIYFYFCIAFHILKILRMKKYCLGVLFIICASAQLPAQITVDTIGTTIVHIETVVDTTHFAGGYDSGPWDLHWGPDDKLWYTNKKQIDRYDPVTGITDTLLRVNSGYIMSLATHNDFANNPYVYITKDTASYYGLGNRVELYRYTYNAAVDSLENPLLILNWGHAGEHSGGRVMFGADTMVYVTTAEYFWQIDTLFNNSGKVLRLHPDGSVPTDNPRPDYTWTWGHRNPQGILQTPNGNIITSEYGMLHDELNLIVPGNHYGWFVFDGISCFQPVDTCNYYQTFVKFPIDIGQNPPSGITWYDHPAIPELNGIIEAVTGINQGLMSYQLNANMDSVIAKTSYLKNEYGRVRDVVAAPSGTVYFIAYDRYKPRINSISNPLFSTLNEQTFMQPLQIYPNPGNNQVHISRKNNNSLSSVRILNSLGSEVLRYEQVKFPFAINSSKLATGVYFFQVTDDNETRIQKWIKVSK